MIRSESPKTFRTCWAMARASSSFMPVRSIEFLIARVRSSTVSVPAGPRSDFVLTAMGVSARSYGHPWIFKGSAPPFSFDSHAATRDPGRRIWGGNRKKVNPPRLHICHGNGGRSGRRVGPDLEARTGLEGTGGVRGGAPGAAGRSPATEGTGGSARGRDGPPPAGR